jgi:hypothetical protein
MRQSFAQPTASSASRSVNPGHHEQTQQQPTRIRQRQDSLSTRTESISAKRQTVNRRHSIHEPRPKNYHRFLAERRSPVYPAGKSACGPILMVEHAYRASRPMGRLPSIKVGTGEQSTTPSSSIASDPAKHQSGQNGILPEPRSAPLPRKEPPKGVSVQAVKNMFESKASQSEAAKPPLLFRTEARITRGVKVSEQIQKLQPSTLSSQRSEESTTSERTRSPASVRTAREVDSSSPVPQPSLPFNLLKQNQIAQRTRPFDQPIGEGWKRGINAPRIGRLDVDRSRRASRTTDDICDPPTVAQDSTRPGLRRNSE